jgi:hypothetical protein
MDNNNDIPSLLVSESNVENSFLAEEDRSYYTYVYYDPRKNPPEPIYVGKGKGKRYLSHLKKTHNQFFERKLNKIKSAGLEPIIEKIHVNLTCDEALELEKTLIQKYKRANSTNEGTLCNYSDGGEGTEGYKHKPETLELFSLQRKGKKQTPAQYEANCSRIVNEETLKKMSAAATRRKRSPEAIEKMVRKSRGSKRNMEIKLKMSKDRTGKPQDKKSYFKSAKFY